MEEFYKSFIPDNVNTFADVGSPMLSVLELINETFKETTIYGLTSHTTLLLLNKDSSLSPWYVGINGLETAPNGQRNEYHIEYLMQSDNQPWSNARVQGGTTSLDELRKYIVIAMIESKGWTDSDELKKLYKELDTKK
ncbi:MAG: hypothetical protein WBC06_16645 [Chitinophagaceae bacterium]